LQAWLDDATAKLQAATTQLTSVETGVLALQPGDNNSRNTLRDYQTQVLAAKSDLVQAQADIQAVRSGLFWAAWWF
jgi:hypothetical protein